MNLTGKVAIVTGGGQGLGRATVQRFVEAGISGVIIADIHSQEANVAAQEIMETYGGQVLAIATDVSDWEQVNLMVQAAMNRLVRSTSWLITQACALLLGGMMSPWKTGGQLPKDAL